MLPKQVRVVRKTLANVGDSANYPVVYRQLKCVCGAYNDVG